MARVDVATQQIVRTGLNPALTAATVDGDVIDTGEVALWVNNASGASINVTVQSTVTQDGLALSNLIVAVPAGAQRLIGPLPTRTFGRTVETADKGRAYVDYSAFASVTRALVKM